VTVISRSLSLLLFCASFSSFGGIRKESGTEGNDCFIGTPIDEQPTNNKQDKIIVFIFFSS
jgi:hypothetical protein